MAGIGARCRLKAAFRPVPERRLQAAAAFALRLRRRTIKNGRFCHARPWSLGRIGSWSAARFTTRMIPLRRQNKSWRHLAKI